MIKYIFKSIPIILLLIFIFTFYIRPLTGYVYTPDVEVTEFSIIINSLFVLFLLICIPITWLYFIDERKTMEIMDYLKIGRKNLGIGIAYGIMTFFITIFVLLLIAIYIKLSGERIENPLAKEIARTLSIKSIILIAVVQSSGEELFFRGFLLEKLSIGNNIHIGVILSSILFGLAHSSYNQIYQIVLPVIIGIVFGYAVKSSKNLISSIIPHVSYNLMSLLTVHFISLTL